jgi:hypothetical protein
MYVRVILHTDLLYCPKNILYSYGQSFPHKSVPGMTAKTWSLFMGQKTVNVAKWPTRSIRQLNKHVKKHILLMQAWKSRLAGSIDLTRRQRT